MISFRERRAWFVGLVSTFVIAVGVFGAFSVNRFEGLRGVYAISADLNDAAGLQPGNEVRVAGVKVGTIKKVTLRSHAARIRMEIEDDIEIPRESRLEVKLKTILGQKFVDLQLPEAYLQASAAGSDPDAVTDGYLKPGDVIPLAQTAVPFEIYEASTEGSALLEEIDKRALRKMLRVLGETVGTSQDEIGRALGGVDAAAEVLSGHSVGISRLLRNARRVTATLAGSDDELRGILSSSAEVLGVLAERRATISTLLAATNDLTRDLGLLIQVARAPVAAGLGDLDGLLAAVEGELAALDAALKEIGAAQELFGRPLSFGRFIEGHVCAITTEDTCVPHGTPEEPGLPVHGVQPSPGAAR